MNNEAKKNKIYADIQILRELGKKVLELNKERAKFEYFKNNQKLIQIDLKLKEIKKYIEDEYPYYGKENIIYDNGVENDETKVYEIKTVESHLEGENEKNDINIDDENIEEGKNNYDENNDNFIEQKQNYDYNNNYNKEGNQMSAKSKEILRRHLEKKKMIKENMEIAETNRRIQDLTLNNRNIVI